MMPQAGSWRNAAARLLPIAIVAMAAGNLHCGLVMPHDIAVGVAYIVVILTASRFCRGALSC